MEGTKMFKGKGITGSLFSGLIRRRQGLSFRAKARGIWKAVAHDPYGQIKWEDTIFNDVVNEGLNRLLDVCLSGGTQITSWYIGLTDGTPSVAAGDTMSSHAGWVEVTAYDEANRVAWTDGGVSSQSVDNSGTPAQFTISTNSTTVGGAFLCESNSKGGTSGELYAAGAFTAGDKLLDDNDTITVTATFTMADDGV
jgi:hypothetical protein